MLAMMSASGLRAEVGSMFRSLSDKTTLWDKNEGGKKKVIEIMKGDTLYSTPATHLYVEEHRGERMLQIPVSYKGMKGWVYLNKIYPVKAGVEDTLRYIPQSSAKNLDVLERNAAGVMEWAMNQRDDSKTYWLYVILISLGAALLLNVCAAGPVWLQKIGIFLMAIALMVASLAELMYILAFYDHVAWFIMPSMVGGWGHAIINFVILAAAIAVQVFCFVIVWSGCFAGGMTTSKDVDTDDVPENLLYWGLYPPVLGVILLVMHLIDSFMSTHWSPLPYYIALGTLLIPALWGMFLLFSRGKIISGIVYPVFYLLAAPGIALLIFALAFMMIIAAILAVIAGFLIMAALGIVGGVLFGRPTVTGKLPDGRRVSGLLDRDGRTVHGRDGNTYTIDK